MNVVHTNKKSKKIEMTRWLKCSIDTWVYKK